METTDRQLYDSVVGDYRSPESQMPRLKTAAGVLAVLLGIPFIFVIVFLNPIAFILLPMAAILMLGFHKTRVHGAAILLSYSYIIIHTGFFSHVLNWQVPTLANVVSSMGLYLLPYIPQSIPRLIVMFAYFWAIYLAPFAVFEIVYWLCHFRRWKTLAAASVCMILVGYAFMGYGERCVENYEKIQAFRGQTLPESELFERCGHPVYKAYNCGPWDARPHWVYTNGGHVIPVTVDEDGMATVREHPYIFFD